MGYAQDEDYEAWAPVFRAIAENVVLSEKLRYKPTGIKKNAPSMVSSTWVLLLVLSAFFVAHVARKDKAAARKWAWAAWVVVSLIYFSGSLAKRNIDWTLDVPRNVGHFIGSSLIPALVLALAAGWRPWRRRQIVENDNLPELPGP